MPRLRDTFYRRRRLARLAVPTLAFLAVLGLAGCIVQEEHLGHLVPENAAAELAGNNVSQARVLQLLGTPSTVSAFNRNKWYYIGEVRQHWAWTAPNVVERQVLILEFDQSRQVARVATLSEADGQEVTLIDRETPTRGNAISVVEQFLGNIGRFNTGGQ